MRSGYGHMVLDYYVERVRRIVAERHTRLAGVTGPEQAIAYQQQVRSAISGIFQPLPPRTPLNARVLGSLHRPRLAIEKIVFESRPGYWVTANLYVPHNLAKPAPAVLVPCGHNFAGKAFHLYQGFGQRLATAGFVCLVFDPVNQGERDQYALLADRTLVNTSVDAHQMMGKQLELIGDRQCRWMAWDGVRALDYLLTRPEVDREHIGVSGTSGGGTQTTYLWPLDDRITMAAPSCVMTTYLCNLENELPTDAEQCPPGMLSAGLDMVDLLIARAPAPILMVGENYDYFDRRGFLEAYSELAGLYKLLDAPAQACAFYMGSHGHSFAPDLQRAVIDFFARQAGMGHVQHMDSTEEIPATDLAATPSASVVPEGSTPIYQIIAAAEPDLSAHRPVLSGDSLRTAVTRLLALPQTRTAAPHYRILRPRAKAATTYARYAVETEQGVRAILHRKVNESFCAFALHVDGDAHLYLPHFASEEDLNQDTLAQSLQQDLELFALDVRGLGESVPDSDLPFWYPYGEDYLCHAFGVMLGESYLGRRVWDALSTMRLLRECGAQHVHLYGRGQGSIIALFAALLDSSVVSLTLKNAPGSFAEWARNPLVSWPAANFPPGILAICDMDDCLQALDIPVQRVDRWTTLMQPRDDEISMNASRGRI